MHSSTQRILEGLFATRGLRPDALGGAETLRPPRRRAPSVEPAAAPEPRDRAAPASVGERTLDAPHTATTSPFLPSITLAEGGAAPASEPGADLVVSNVLGEGGMGVVHAATQRSLARSVAIKRPLLAQQSDDLVFEGRIMASVEHPNVVPVHALGRDANERAVLVMKHVDGASLRTLLRQPEHTAWPRLLTRWGDRLGAIVGILGEVADALDHAHAQGIVHRDVKSENVMVGAFGEVYLLDWGIALRVGTPSPATVGQIVGTPGFMAPEMVLDPDGADARTDVYLLGALLHEALTGRLRHRGDSLFELLGAAVESEPFAYGPAVPGDLAALANRATSREPADRPESALAFRAALGEHTRHREAHGLLAAARAAMEPLVAGRVSLVEPEAASRLAEAVAALGAARRVHPEAVEADHDRYLALATEREIALESPVAARTFSRRRRAPDPDHEARIDALEARQEATRSQAQELARAKAEADVSVTMRQRVWLLAAVFVPVLLGTIFLTTTELAAGAELTTRGLLTTNLVATLMLGVGLTLGRAYFFGNRGNRLLSFYGATAFLGATWVHLVSYLTDVPTPVALAYAHALIGTVFAVGAIAVAPGYWLGAVSSVILCAGFVLHPEWAAVLSPLGMLGVIGGGIYGTMDRARRQGPNGA
ncbi:MAG: serine/threonine-protein kinase [Sandaracinus sp.]